MNISNLSITSLNKAFIVDREELQVLHDINMEIKAGEFVSVLGHSGCGKSTLLKIIAGLVSYESGTVETGGKRIFEPNADRGMVFQDHRLLPWMTIKENVAIGLHHLPAKERDRVTTEYLKLVKLEGFENSYPHQLSGGMAQRAAIARALVNKPEILLLDEPFGALDALTRIQMQKEILRIWNQGKTTMALVTHDIDEAIYLSDRIFVMSSRPGTIQTIIPVDIGRPRDRGSSNFAHIKKRVLSHFFHEDVAPAEYYI